MDDVSCEQTTVVTIQTQTRACFVCQANFYFKTAWGFEKVCLQNNKETLPLLREMPGLAIKIIVRTLLVWVLSGKSTDALAVADTKQQSSRQTFSKPHALLPPAGRVTKPVERTRSNQNYYCLFLKQIRLIIYYKKICFKSNGFYF